MKLYYKFANENEILEPKAGLLNRVSPLKHGGSIAKFHKISTFLYKKLRGALNLSTLSKRDIPKPLFILWLIAFAWVGREVLLELIRGVFKQLGFRKLWFLLGQDRSLGGIFPIHLDPFLTLGI